MYTEKQARLKWCPHARVTDNGCATNRHAGEKTGKDGKPRILRGNALCIASECMAWRQAKGAGVDIIGSPPRERTKNERLGFCGLAGEPK